MTTEQETAASRCNLTAATLWLLALSSNLTTCGTYYRSADDFPRHMRWQNATIDAFQQPSDAPLFAFIAIGCSSLLISNLFALPNRLYQYFHMPITPSSTSNATCCLSIDIFSALFKTLVSSTSLLAIFADGDQNRQLWLGAVIAAFFFLGNAFANLTNFWEPLGLKTTLCQNKNTASWLSCYSSASYALCQTALYFNQFDAGFAHAGWLTGRLTEANSVSKKIMLGVALCSSLTFGVTSYLIYRPKIFDLLTPEPTTTALDQNNIEANLLRKEDQNDEQCCIRLTWYGAWSTAWKVTVISLVTIGILNENEQFSLGATIAGVTLLGNILIHLTYYSAATVAQHPTADTSPRGHIGAEHGTAN